MPSLRNSISLPSDPVKVEKVLVLDNADTVPLLPTEETAKV
ncbi:hypothetical protein [uncultured Ruminococcus sp.]|nr:hypothetical protein [uncultured Ruminococcus sp.]